MNKTPFHMMETALLQLHRLSHKPVKCDHSSLDILYMSSKLEFRRDYNSPHMLTIFVYVVGFHNQ